MADSIKFTIGGQLGQSYRGALSQAVNEAQVANRRINAVMSGMGGGGHVGGSMRGAMMESIVVLREIMEGRGTARVLGSVTLLLQRMGALNFLFKDTKNTAALVAEAYAHVAMQANASALATARKAEASAAAFTADASDSAASLEQAVSDEAAAIAARQHASAMLLKAEAAQASAAAQGAEAAATGMGLISIIGIVASVALALGVVYERIWGVKNLLKELSFDTSNIAIKDDYIPMMKRHINDAKNEQKALNEEVRKTAEHYFSVEEASKRAANATKEHFNHLRKMNEFSGGTDEEKARKEAAINKQEREQDITDQTSKQKGLQAESDRKLAAAADIKVKTKEEDEQDQSGLDQRKEAAEAFLKGGGVWKEFKKQAAIKLGGASGQLIDETEQGGFDLAQSMIDQANKHRDKVLSNDELRKRKGDLEKEGNKAAADAKEIDLNLPNLRDKKTQKDKDEQEELDARLAQAKGHGGRMVKNDWESAGIFQAGPQIALHDTMKESLKVQKSIERNTRSQGKSNPGALNAGDGPGIT